MLKEPTPLLTNEVARILDVSADTVRHLERMGRLPALRTSGGVRLFNRCDVERLARERRAAATPTPGDSPATAVA
jgi:excisionase family DNA binding protein